MNKKGLKTLAITAGAIALIYTAGSMASFWGFYRIPSPSNEPNLKTGSHIFVSAFEKPALYNFVVYTSHATDSMSFPGDEKIKKQKYVHRLCGFPGDVLQMKNGVLFVNNHNFDKELNLVQPYKISEEDFTKLDEKDFPEDKGGVRSYYGGLTIVLLDKSLKEKYKRLIKLEPYYFPGDETTNGPFAWCGKGNAWTIDNFGPLKIPPDSCFVIGDNRANSLDSRYTGLIAVKDIKGVVLNKN